MLINRLNTADSDFDRQLDGLLAWEEGAQTDVDNIVRDIIDAVRAQGDTAVLRYTKQFDGRDLKSMADAVVDEQRLQQALNAILPEQRHALEAAAERIRRYHEKQRQHSWQYSEPDGTVLGQKITALDRVGLYVPGGKASYPSSVLMAAIPAKVAGVQELVLVSPFPQGELNNMVLAAAAVVGVDRVYSIGGAQAIAAMAYGTETVPAVDKIVGPGNVYVAAAKRQVFGKVDIDMIAGPSEILVLSDGSSSPDWLAMDLFSQAEHDEDAQAILISSDRQHLDAVYCSIEKLLPTLQRKNIAAISLQKRGALIQAQDSAQAVSLVNRIAPEHLEISTLNPDDILAQVRHAGAIFMGRYTSESLGDYCAGPNHVLPTSGTARFSSPLGVYDYVKRSSIIHCSAQGASELGKIASVLARSESLEAHARSAEFRIKK